VTTTQVRPASSRLVGLDVARAVALLGMAATHVLDARDDAGALTLSHAVFGGRASALFAVLAGVSVALVTGRGEPLVGEAAWRARAALAVRALLVASVGLLLGGLETGVAVILAYYGVLFLLGLPFTGLRARPLFVLAAAWVVVGPLVSLAVRPELPDRGFDSPNVEQLVTPGHLLAELLLTGYYPALLWLAYLLVGMGVGRLDLGARAVQVGLLGWGAALAAAASASSYVLSRGVGFSDADLGQISSGMFGQTPTDDWRWQLVVAPHSTTPFDLAQTIGTSLAAVGACLLVVSWAARWAQGRGERVVAVLAGAGTMTLTLYTLHVLMLTPELPPEEEPTSYVVHVLVLVWVGALFVAVGRRGPLERAVAAITGPIRGRAGRTST